MQKVTVVIPNFNGIRYIEKCLDSLFGQEGQDFETVIVDNGSSDGSYELIRDRYCANPSFSALRLIRLEENTGFCHAVNLGIQEADSPYVLLLNNDTQVLEGFLKYLIRAIESDEKLFSVSACMLQWDRPEILDGAGDRYCVLGWAYARGRGRPYAKFDAPVEVFSACGGAAIYRKQVLREIGLFDEGHFAYLEDVDIGYRARIYGYRSRYEPKARVLHIGSASSGSRYNAFKTGLVSSNSVYLIWKNMPLLQWVWNMPFLFLGFFIKTVYFSRQKMGMLYMKGIWRGMAKCRGESAPKKIPFRWKYLGNYLAIQWQLYINMFRVWMAK
jgi:GT2 family glycosyltransferase